MSSYKERLAELLRKGENFSLDDLGEVRVILAREVPADDVPEARGGAFEAIYLIVADPRYRGDITLKDLGEVSATEHTADAILAQLFG